MSQKIREYINKIKSGKLKEMKRQTKWVYDYAKRYKWSMLFYTVLGLSDTGISLILCWVTKNLVDIVTGANDAGLLLKNFICMVILNVVSLVISQISSYISAKISMKVDADIKSDIFAKILVTDWESLTNYHTGDLLTRWSSDASVISAGVLNYIPTAIIAIVKFVAAFAMVVYNDWTFAVLAFLGVPVSVILSKTLVNRMVNNNKKSAMMGAKLSGFNQEAFSNIQTIKAFSLIRLYIERLNQLQKEYIDMKMSFKRMSIWTSVLLSTVGLLVSYASYGWGVYRVWTGAITYGAMTMFLGLSGTLTATLHNITALIPSAISITTSAGRLMDIVEMPREDLSHENEADEFARKNKDTGLSLHIENLSFAYQNGNQVFSNASLEAYPHETIAIVGPSGEGKTTMLRLIMSLMPQKEGKAYLSSEGKEEFELGPSTRRLFSYVPQGNTLFSGSIAYNMRAVKPDATDEEIINALKIACAWEFVEKLPEGINAEIKERGGGFSEGQAQRLSIARALMRKSPLLLLDEATSALDVATERRLLRNIMQDEYPRTCIVTTHRPTVLNVCKRVYAIKNRECVILNEAEIKRMMDEF